MAVNVIQHKHMSATLIEMVIKPNALERDDMAACVAFRPFGHTLKSIYTPEEAMEIGMTLALAGEEAQRIERDMRAALEHF